MARKIKHIEEKAAHTLSSSTLPIEQKEEFLRLLTEKLGILSLACSQFNLSLSDLEQWRASDPELDRRIDECQEIALDFVESRMFEKINKGDARLIRFYLETRGKKRGYFIKKEFETVSSVPVILTLEEALILGVPRQEALASTVDHSDL